jgi:hypothetical protein
MVKLMSLLSKKSDYNLHNVFESAQKADYIPNKSNQIIDKVEDEKFPFEQSETF